MPSILSILEQNQMASIMDDLAKKMHGDIVASVPDDNAAPGITSYAESTEFGAPRDPASAPDAYGWLGQKRRSTNDLGGLTLMGVRLYDAATGRFLSVDPVPGGTDNSYVYPTNPIDGFDLSGQWGHWRQWGWNTVGFLSYRPYISGANSAIHGRWHQAWRNLNGGLVSGSVSGYANAGSRGYHSQGFGWRRSLARAMGGAGQRGFATFISRATPWWVGAIATSLDYGRSILQRSHRLQNQWRTERGGLGHIRSYDM